MSVTTIESEEIFTNRQAKCFCGTVRSSRPTQLAFLEYRGSGSRYSMLCRVCGEASIAHSPVHPHTGNPGITNHEWVANGPQEYDIFYCWCKEEDE